jgi:hypothetical protein
MKSGIIKTILWVFVFSVAMAFLESAVVVYLRALYYPEGFTFPLKLIAPEIAVTEFIRELATMVMLIGIGIIAGRKNIERFAFFIFSFAIWDIFYYVFLKLLLGWPSSLLTCDILFMIPLSWVGPVIAPVINSLTMLLLASVIIYFVEKKGFAQVGTINWILLIIGSLIIIVSYMLEYTDFMLKHMSIAELFNYNNSEKIIKFTTEFIPARFNWILFIIGEFFHLLAIGFLYFRMKNKYQKTYN